MKREDISQKDFLEALDELEAAELEELEKIAAEAEKNPHQFSKEFEEWKESAIRELEEKENASRNEKIKENGKIPEDGNAATEELAASMEPAADEDSTLTGKRSFFFHFINTPFKKAAIAAAFVAVVALGAGVQSEAGKFPVVKFFQELYGDYVAIEPHEDLRKNEEKPQSIEAVYELGWVPEGYEKSYEDISEYMAVQSYYNEKNNIEVILQQFCVKAYFSIEQEKDLYEEIKHEQKKYYYLEKAEEKTLVWYEDGYQFIIRGDTENKELFKMAENLEKIQ